MTVKSNQFKVYTTDLGSHFPMDMPVDVRIQYFCVKKKKSLSLLFKPTIGSETETVCFVKFGQVSVYLFSTILNPNPSLCNKCHQK